MPDVTMNVKWVIHADTPEYRLIVRGLTGRLKPEELEAANELGDKLTLMRAQTTRQMLKTAEETINAVTSNT